MGIINDDIGFVSREALDARLADEGIKRETDASKNLVSDNSPLGVLDSNNLNINGQTYNIKGIQSAGGTFFDEENDQVSFGSTEGTANTNWLSNTIANADDVYVEDAGDGQAYVYVDGVNVSELKKKQGLNTYQSDAGKTDLSKTGYGIGQVEDSVSSLFASGMSSMTSDLYNASIKWTAASLSQVGINSLNEYSEDLDFEKELKKRTPYSSYKSLKWDEPSTWLKYTARTVGELLPIAAAMYVTRGKGPMKAVGKAWLGTTYAGEALEEMLGDEGAVNATPTDIVTSSVVGAMNFGLDKFGFEKFTKFTPRNLTKAMGSNSVQLAKSLGISKGEAGDLLKAMFAEAATEVTQELTSITGAYLARGKEYTNEEILERAKEAGIKAGIGVGTFRYTSNVMTNLNDFKNFKAQEFYEKEKENLLGPGDIITATDVEVEKFIAESETTLPGNIINIQGGRDNHKKLRNRVGHFVNDALNSNYGKVGMELAESFALAPAHAVLRAAKRNGANQPQLREIASVLQFYFEHIGSTDVVSGTSMSVQLLRESLIADDLAVSATGLAANAIGSNMSTGRGRKEAVESIEAYASWINNKDAVDKKGKRLDEKYKFNDEVVGKQFKEVLNMALQNSDAAARIYKNAGIEIGYKGNYPLTSFIFTDKYFREGSTGAFKNPLPELVNDLVDIVGFDRKSAVTLGAAMLKHQDKSPMQLMEELGDQLTYQEASDISAKLKEGKKDKSGEVRYKKPGSVEATTANLASHPEFVAKWGEKNFVAKAATARKQAYNYTQSKKFIGSNGEIFDKVMGAVAGKLPKGVWDDRMSYTVREALVRSRGLKPINPNLEKLYGFMMTWNILTMMIKSTFASVPELALAGRAIRGNSTAMNEVRNYGTESAALMKEALSISNKDNSYKDITTFGEPLQIALLRSQGFTQENSGQTTLSHIDLHNPNLTSVWTQTMLDFVFKFNGLSMLTNITRAHTLGLLIPAIDSWSKILVEKPVGKQDSITEAQAYAVSALRELGLDPHSFPELHFKFYQEVVNQLGNQPAFVELHNKVVNKPEAVSAEEMVQYKDIIEKTALTLRQDPTAPQVIQEYNTQLRGALHVGLSDRIVHSEITSRPLYYSNPLGRPLFQFLGFLGTFTARILPKLVRDIKSENPELQVDAIKTAATMMFLSFLSQTLRDELDDREVPEGLSFYLRGAYGSGLLGTYERFVGAALPVRDMGEGAASRLASGLMGPSVSQIERVGKFIGSATTNPAEGKSDLTSYHGLKLTPIIAQFIDYNDYK